MTLDTMHIHDETFRIIKPERLLSGIVLQSTSRPVFARIGPKESTLEEQIHTESLRAKGFPVARVLESGDYGQGEWYFIEESLGDETFHEQFANDYQAHGSVQDDTFERYARVMEKYCAAQSDIQNRTHISAQEFVQQIIPSEEIDANYLLCGGDLDRYHQAITQATEALHDAPMGVIQQDLNPFNILDNGVIDFELVGYGPIGYDGLLVSQWHLWFTDDSASRYSLAYRLSTEQCVQIAQIATRDVDSLRYLQEFLLIKSAWGFSSQKSINDEPDSKANFYRFRARILEHCVDAYLAGDPINPPDFPSM